MVDRALEQTRTLGMRYAAIPTPWLFDWLHWIESRGGGRFQWWECCIHPSRDLANCEEDGNGNTLMCLLPHLHEGDCGYVF